MPDMPPGVMGAPNRCWIQARVLEVEQSSAFPDKWMLELEILETKDREGPNFAHVGDEVKGFTFSDEGFLSGGDTIAAEAEYVGGPRGGQFQLSDVKVVP
jgi:hypothetical protein